jgi:NADH-quinone oxidoreductase subunit J
MVEAILFYAFAAILVVSAVLTVTVKNIFHAALFLALALFAVAGLYVGLGAHFLSAVQVLVYIGAVVVLAIFVINLTRNTTGSAVTLSRRWIIPSMLVSGLTACLIIIALLKAGSAGASSAPPPPAADATAVLGRYLLGDYILPFELVSVLLLSALIASIVIVSRDPEDRK